MFRFDRDSEALAKAYERTEAALSTPGRQLVDLLRLQPGDRVLDVGCGTGVLTEYASRTVGPEGLVVGIDPLPRRVSIAQQRNWPNVKFEVGSAFDLSQFERDYFDAAYLHAVFHWLTDRTAALQQLHRVLKPGARLGLTMVAREHENTFAAVCVALFSRPPYSEHADPRQTGAQRMSRKELSDLFASVGFRPIDLDLQVSATTWATADEAVGFYETVAGGNLFGHFPERLREQARTALVSALESRRDTAGIRMDGSRIVALAARL